MKKLIITLLILTSFWAAVPWTSVGLPQLDTKLGDYKLGLDLHGGVELDYLVDFSTTPDLTPERKTQILEDMKTILD
jgi:preprotein translocase subunit SecD